MKIIILFSILLLSGCIETKLDASTEKSMEQSSTQMLEGKSDEQKANFSRAMQVIAMTDVNGIEDLVAVGENEEKFMKDFKSRVNGKTYRQIIDQANTIVEKKGGQKIQNSKIDIKEIGSEVKKGVIEKELYKSVTVTLTSKEVVKHNYSNYLKMNLDFENNTDKQIDDVKGQLVFKDIFDDVIKKISISMDETIPAEKTIVYNGSMDINQFIDSDVKLSTIDADKMKFNFEPEMIIFEDGTILELE